jgi:hypothetical protein
MAVVDATAFHIHHRDHVCGAIAYQTKKLFPLKQFTAKFAQRKYMQIYILYIINNTMPGARTHVEGPTEFGEEVELALHIAEYIPRRQLSA